MQLLLRRRRARGQSRRFRRAATGSIARRSRFVMGSFVVLLEHGSPLLGAAQATLGKQPPGTCAEDARKA